MVSKDKQLPNYYKHRIRGCQPLPRFCIGNHKPKTTSIGISGSWTRWKKNARKFMNGAQQAAIASLHAMPSPFFSRMCLTLLGCWFHHFSWPKVAWKWVVTFLDDSAFSAFICDVECQIFSPTHRTHTRSSCVYCNFLTRFSASTTPSSMSTGKIAAGWFLRVLRFCSVFAPKSTIWCHVHTAHLFSVSTSLLSLRQLQHGVNQATFFYFSSIAVCW